MKKARMNISHSRFILLKLKIFGEIVTTKFISLNPWFLEFSSDLFRIIDVTTAAYKDCILNTYQ